MKEILIIEDEILVAKSIEQSLVHHGYKVAGIANNCQKAKRLLLSVKPDLILCDVNLNDTKNGIELLKEVDPQYNIPIIFISGCTEMSILEEANLLDPFNYITKPFSEEQLIVSVNRFFATQRPKEEEQPTDKEMAVLSLIARGYSSKEIAEELSVSFHTVESHRKNMLYKYKVRSMAELVCLATSRSWIEYKPH